MLFLRSNRYIQETRSAGSHEIYYKLNRILPGIYILRLVTLRTQDGMEQIKKIVLKK